MASFEYIASLLKFLELKLSGKLTSPDGSTKDFAKVSVRAVGKQGFVIKGWVDTKKGPMVKFSCPWGDVADGETYYQEKPGGDIEDTEEQDINFSNKKLTATFDRVSGEEYSVEFSAKA